MANILYRETITPTVPGTTTQKGQPLTNNEVDGNFKSISDDLNLKATTATLNSTVSTLQTDINTRATIDSVASQSIMYSIALG